MIANDAVLLSRTARTLVDVVPAANRILRALVLEKTPPGLSLPQYRVLVLLLDHPELTLKDVAAREGVEPPTVSRTVESLVELGWVTRRIDPEDRRCLRLSATPEGALLVEAVRSEIAVAVEEFLKGWETTDLEGLRRGLSLLASVGEA